MTQVKSQTTTTMKKKPVSAHATAKKHKDLAVLYQQYFSAPMKTPDAFRILDLGGDSGFSYSSHT